jgi:hypothetical protein
MTQKTFTDQDIQDLKARLKGKPLSDRTLKSLCPAANISGAGSLI